MRTAMPPVTEESRTSLAERVAALHYLWGQLTDDLTPAHVNHFERPGVLPIAFSLVHYVSTEDRILALVLGGSPLWDAHLERIRLTGIMPKYGTPMEDAERVRIGDLDAWRVYQRAVFERTERMLADAPLDRLAARFEMKPPSVFAGFLKVLVGSEEFIRGIDRLEISIYHHGARHAGELEHARALVGLRGA